MITGRRFVVNGTPNLNKRPGQCFDAVCFARAIVWAVFSTTSNRFLLRGRRFVGTFPIRLLSAAQNFFQPNFFSTLNPGFDNERHDGHTVGQVKNFFGSQLSTLSSALSSQLSALADCGATSPNSRCRRSCFGRCRGSGIVIRLRRRLRIVDF